MTTYAVRFLLWQQNHQGNPVLIEVIYPALSRCSLFLDMFWQIDHANSAYFRLFLGYFRVASATRPPFGSRPPFLHNLDPPLIFASQWPSLLNRTNFFLSILIHQHTMNSINWEVQTKVQWPCSHKKKKKKKVCVRKLPPLFGDSVWFNVSPLYKWLRK